MSHLTIFLSSWLIDGQETPDLLLPGEPLQRAPQVSEEGRVCGAFRISQLSNLFQKTLSFSALPHKTQSRGQLTASLSVGSLGVTSFRYNIDCLKKCLSARPGLYSVHPHLHRRFCSGDPIFLPLKCTGDGWVSALSLSQ